MKNEKKSSISPFVFLVFGILIIGFAAFVLLRDQPAAETKHETHAEKPQDSAEPGEPIMPDPAATIASSTQQEQESFEFRVPAFHQNVDALTLPPVMDPATVAPEARAAYTIVKNKPKLIAQLPCFCYCERWGHGSLHDCFVTEHAVTCDVCMNEAIQADKMDREGVPAAEIRETIVAQFRAAASDDHAGHNH
jgi:hypothetical protein